MVDEFHQFARMPVPEQKSSDLNQIVQNVLNLYVERSKIPRIGTESAAHIQMDSHLDPNLPPASVDPEQIAQALGNLIENAIEAMPDGGTLSVATRLVKDRKIQIGIQDTGIGMSAETQAEIFTPYYTTKEAGTGLSMAIVQRIITDHDGEIFVESKEGVGTMVQIELPARNAEEVRRNNPSCHL